MHHFASIAVIDARGRILLQERDEHAPVDPNRWGLPGGGLESGEDYRRAAVRELAEETGLRVHPHELTSLGVVRFYSESCRTDDEFELFVVVLDVTDDDVVCGEGRQMIFVEPASIEDLDVLEAATLALPRALQWRAEQRRFAGVILVDPRGWILLQERDEHPRIDPKKWTVSGGHLEPDESFEVGAHRELEEETGVRLAPGELELYGEFMVDHRQAYGSWDRMQVFVAATTLTDADIECHEGLRIVFISPDEALGLDLSAAAAIILPAFLASTHYQDLAGANS